MPGDKEEEDDDDEEENKDDEDDSGDKEEAEEEKEEEEWLWRLLKKMKLSLSPSGKTVLYVSFNVFLVMTGATHLCVNE